MNGFVKLDLSEFKVRISMLKKPQAPVVRALNKAAASGRTHLVRAVAGETGLKSSVVRDFIQVQPATFTNLEATLYASAKRVPLIDFNAKGPIPSRGQPGGVTARLKGGAGRYPNAFIIRLGSGHLGVFARSGRARLPIVQLHGPSIYGAAKKHEAAAVARAHEQLAKVLPHEIEFEFSR